MSKKKNETCRVFSGLFNLLACILVIVVSTFNYGMSGFWVSTAAVLFWLSIVLSLQPE